MTRSASSAASAASPYAATMAPMGSPSSADLGKAMYDITALNNDSTHLSTFPGTNAGAIDTNYATRERLEQTLADMLRDIVAIPDAPVRLGKLIDKDGPHPNQYRLTFGPHESAAPISLQDKREGPINPEDMVETMARYGAEYRQAIAMRRLKALIPSYQPVGQDPLKQALANRFNHEGGIGLKPCHPAVILLGCEVENSNMIVDHDFTTRYKPRLRQGTPCQPWVEERALTTRLTMTMSMSESLIASLPGTRLCHLIELPQDAPAKMAPHAIDAWENIVIDDAQGFDDRIFFTLAPTRQVCWSPHALGPDHIPINEIEQALVNVARTAEVV